MASSLIFLFTFSVLADSNGVLGRRGFERRLQLHNHASKGIKFGSSGGPDINFGSGSASPIKLPGFNVDENMITISGFSSGGSFAQQLQISHSSLFRGIAVFSHTFYKCGPGNGIEKDYDDVCTTLGNGETPLWDPNQAMADIQQYARSNQIDPISNLRGKKLYVYTGTHNWLFTTDQSLRILNIYEPLIKDPSAIFTRVQAANLTLPSDRFGGSCASDSINNFFIAKCGLSGPYDALKFILGDFVSKPNARSPVRLQPLQLFDQKEFFNESQNVGLDTAGFLYVPRECRNGRIRCYLHFYFHGCTVGREFVSENHIRNSGYLELAELNRIIMVFPQASNIEPENMIGCWDTYGLTGKDFATKKGAQVSAVRKMLSRVLSSPESLTSSSNRPTTGYQDRWRYPQYRKKPSRFRHSLDRVVLDAHTI